MNTASPIATSSLPCAAERNSAITPSAFLNRLSFTAPRNWVANSGGSGAPAAGRKALSSRPTCPHRCANSAGGASRGPVDAAAQMRSHPSDRGTPPPMSRTPSRRADFRWFRAVTTRWMDNDVYGHVNNVVYYAWIDTAVNRFLLDDGVLDIAASPAVGMVAETGCRYFSPISFPDDGHGGHPGGGAGAVVGALRGRHLPRRGRRRRGGRAFRARLCGSGQHGGRWRFRPDVAGGTGADCGAGLTGGCRRVTAMDLGLKGKRAIVCAASKGLGRACAMALAREGVDVVITARTADVLERTAAEIRAATGVKVTAVPGDIATEAGRAAALAACPEPDILVNNAGGPPPGDFRDWARDDWIRALDANMLAPIFLIRAVIDGMIARKFGRIVNITSGSVKSPIPHLGMSNGARAGLTGFVGGLARQVARHNVTINSLLPGAILTDRLSTTMQAEAAEDRQEHRRSHPGPRPRHAGRAGGRSGGIRRRLRVPVRRLVRLHRRAEPAARRRRLQQHDGLTAMTELAFLPASRLAALVRQRRIGCLELLDHMLARVERLDGRLNAVVVRDFDRARAAARQLDRKREPVGQAARRADDGEGELRHRRPADHLGRAGQAGHAPARRAGGRPAEGGRRGGVRQDQRAALAGGLAELQRDLRGHQQSVGPLAFAGRLVRRRRGGGWRRASRRWRPAATSAARSASPRTPAASSGTSRPGGCCPRAGNRSCRMRRR